MTRTRKLTLSVKEFSHLVSESLDIANAAPPQSFVDNTAVFSESPQKSHHRLSSFQRIFSRPTPTPAQRSEDLPQGPPPEDVSEAPRKMIAWPFPRSPRKNRPAKDEDNPTEVNDPEVLSQVYSVVSLATASTSSLGSLIPAHERLFQVASGEPGARSQNHHEFKGPGESPNEDLLDAIFGNGSTMSVTIETTAGSSSRASVIRASFEETETSRSVANSEPDSLDEDPTPRASTFGSRATLRPSGVQNDAQRGRPHGLSLVVPSRNLDLLVLRPAVGVTPHVPSETDSTVSLCSPSPPTSPVARASSPTLPTTQLSEPGPSPPVPPTFPNPRVSATSLGIVSPSNLESAPPFGFSPRQRRRAMSRSLTPPPLSRPPPTGPLPAVPSSVPPVPPVPPLPSLLSKMSVNTSTGPQPAVSSPPRSNIAGTAVNPATALPPSPPGGLRLPSRLSWVTTVRAVLPSPPASPTKSLKPLTCKTVQPISPSKAEMKRSGELKRPTSIGVIEAADNVQVRRTKSILLLGSRSKSTASLGPKRVQIHADVNLDANPTPKPRRKSSAATVGHPVFSSGAGPVMTPMPSPELVVPRERRHSAPVLSSADSKAPGSCADWTLSLPFCTDVPGEKILLSPLSTPQLKPEDSLEDVQGEDWTLCMPLKRRVGTPTMESSEAANSECTSTDASETVEAQPVVQLPTPSPSPTWPTPTSDVRTLDPEESMPLPEERPASPASLGPHVGGLDLAGGRGKRASGWHVYGWFDEVDVLGEDRDVVSPTMTAFSECKSVKNHITVFRKTHDVAGRHPSQDSMSTVSTSGATFYSARSSLMVN